MSTEEAKGHVLPADPTAPTGQKESDGTKLRKKMKNNKKRKEKVMGGHQRTVCHFRGKTWFLMK